MRHLIPGLLTLGAILLGLSLGPSPARAQGPVPEPGTTAAIGALALCALIGDRERRRLGTVYGRLVKKNRV